MANSISDSILKAFNIIADATVDSLTNDTTIKATITKIVNLDKKQYSASYNGGYISVYAQGNETYKENDYVYVLVPQGNMSNTKYILGLVETASTNSLQTESSEEEDIEKTLSDYTLIGTNIVTNSRISDNSDIYFLPVTLKCNKVNNYKLCYDSSIEDKITSVTPRLEIDNDTLYKNMQEAEGLLIKADFTTDLPTNANGNYGIVAVVNAEQNNEDTTIAYILDTSKMTGNPMEFYSSVSQYMICDFSNIKFKSIESISMFTMGFVDTNTDEDCGTVTINNFEIYALEQLAANENGYKLSLTTPNNNEVKIDQDVTIQARLFKENTEITDTISFSWGIEDFTVNSLSANYSSKLGSGFKKIDSSSDSITLKFADNPCSKNRYRCVAVDESNTILATKDIYIYNNSETIHNIELKTNSGGTTFYIGNGQITITCCIDGKTSDFLNTADDSEFTFLWSKDNDDTGIIVFDKAKEVLELEKKKALETEEAQSNSSIAYQIKAEYNTKIAQVTGYSFNKGINGNKITVPPQEAIYYCSIYRNNKLFGSASIALKNAEEGLSQQSYITIENGRQSFQYNEKGVSPASDRVQNPITVKDLIIKFKNPLTGKEITDNVDLSYSWELPSGNTLINIPSTNVNEDGYYLGQVFPLTIAETYDSNYTDNQLVAIVKYKDQVYRQSTELFFSKVGETGTNGTNTTFKLASKYSPEDTDSKFAVINENNKYYWNVKNEENNYIALNKTETPFKTSVYMNNELQDGYTTSWSFMGLKNPKENADFQIDENGMFYPRESTEYSGLDYRTVRAEVKFNNTKLYNYFNIPTIKYLTDKYNYSEYPISVIDSKTLDNILYDSDNSNPAYNTNIGVTLKVPENLYNTSKIKWTVESGPRTIKETDGIEYYSYNSPNFLISFNQNTGSGGNTLVVDNEESTLTDFINILNTITDNSDSESLIQLQSELNTIILAGDDISTMTAKMSSVLNVFKTENENSWVSEKQDIYSQYSNYLSEISNDYRNASYVNTDLIRNRRFFADTIGSSLSSIYITSLSDKDIYGKTGKGQKLITNCGQLVSCNLGEVVYDDGIKLTTAELNNILHTSLQNLYKTLQLNLQNIIAQARKYTSDFNSILLEQYNFYFDKFAELSLEKDNLSWEEMKKKGKDFYDKIYLIFITNMDTLAFDKNQSPSVINYKTYLSKENEQVEVPIYIIPNDKMSPAYSNNNVIITFSKQDEEIIKIIVPICFTSNVYSLGSLNGWDGIGIEINEEEGYILSPQIGAGVKDSTTNKFTGVVMGALSNATESGYSAKDKVGIMGFHDGQQSIFLDSKTGNAYFGVEDGTDNDGCIELIPGGTSKIANWNIAKNLLYSSGSGNPLETRQDSDSRDAENKNRKMLSKTDSGIVISSDLPYIHIKSAPFTAEMIGRTVRSTDGFHPINVGDSLEIKLDPNNNSLFSIVQYTDSVNIDDMDGIYCGQYTETNGVKKVEDFDINDKTKFENNSNLKFVTYVVPQENNQFLPYYTLGNNWMVLTSDPVDNVNIVASSDAINQWDNKFTFDHSDLDATTGKITLSNFITDNTLNLDSDHSYKINYIDSETKETKTFDRTNENLELNISSQKGVSNFTQTLATIIPTEKDEELQYIQKPIDGQEILLYKFALTQEKKIISLTQRIDIDENNLLVAAGLNWKLRLKWTSNGQTYSVDSESSNSIFEFNYDAGFPIQTEMEIYIYITTKDQLSYNYYGEIVAECKATTAILPDVNWKLLGYKNLGMFYPMGDEIKTVEFDEATFNYTMNIQNNNYYLNITNQTNNKTYDVVVYCINTSYNTCYKKTFEKLATNETISILANGTSQVHTYEYYFAFYETDDIHDGSKIIISDNPKYSLSNLYINWIHNKLLNATVYEPTNFNDKVAINKEYLCCSGDIRGLPIATSSYVNGDRYIEFNIDNIKEYCGQVVPGIDWVDYVNSETNIEETTRVLRGFDKETIIDKNIAGSSLTNSLYSYMKESIKVGLDEKGEFYSTGAANTSIKSKLGPVKGFNYYTGYGQSLVVINDYKQRTYLQSFTDKNFNSKTTSYLTPGDNKNLTIVADDILKLYVYGEDYDKINPIPSVYSGVNITEKDITLTVANKEFFIKPTTINKMNSLFSLSENDIANLLDNVKINTQNFNNVNLTGTPTAPTATAGTSDTQIATTEFVMAAIANAFAERDGNNVSY
jgi:hypothetical protein